MPDSNVITDIKISELPAASQANAGDQLEANQAGTTRRITLDQIATVVADSDQVHDAIEDLIEAGEEFPPGVQSPISLPDYSHFMRATFAADNRIIGPYYHGTQHGSSAFQGVCQPQGGTTDVPLLINGDYAVDGVVTLDTGTRVQITSRYDLSTISFRIEGTISGVPASSVTLVGPNKGRVLTDADDLFTLITAVVPLGNTAGDVAVGLYYTPANSELRYSDDDGQTWSDPPLLLVSGLETGIDRGYQSSIGIDRATGHGFVQVYTIDIATGAAATKVRHTTDNGTTWSGESLVAFTGLAAGSNGVIDPTVTIYSPWRQTTDGAFVSTASYYENVYWLRTTNGSVVDCTHFAVTDHCMPNGGSWRIEAINDAAKTVTILDFVPGYGNVSAQFPAGMAIRIVGTGAANGFGRVASAAFVGGKTVVTLDALPPGGVIAAPNSRILAASWKIAAFNDGLKQVTLDAVHGDARAYFPVNMTTTIGEGGSANGTSFVTAVAFTAGQTVVTLFALTAGGVVGADTVLRQTYGPRQIIGVTLPSTVKVQFDQTAFFHASPVPPAPGVMHLVGMSGSEGAATDGIHKVVSCSYDAPSNTTSIVIDKVLANTTVNSSTRVTDVVMVESGFDVLDDETFVCAARPNAQLGKITLFATQDAGATTSFLGETNMPRGSYISATLDFVDTPTGIKTLIGGFQTGGIYKFWFIAANTADLFDTVKNFTPNWYWRTTNTGVPNSGYQSNMLYPGNSAVITYGIETSIDTAELYAERLDLAPVLDAANSVGEATTASSFVVPEQEGTPLHGFVGELSDGTGRYNTYMSGEAQNYFAGGVQIGNAASATTTNAASLRLWKPLTGGAIWYSLRNDGIVQSDVTSAAYYYRTAVQIADAGFTLAALTHFGASQGAIPAAATVTNQYGFRAASTLSGATNNYGFVGDLTVSGTSNWNFYAPGTAPNQMAGGLTIGSATLNSANLRIAKTLTGGTTQYGVRNESVVQSDVTATVYYNRTVVATAAAAFTLASLQHYTATQGTFGAASAVTNQYGFRAESTLIGAGTGNYGFYGDLPAGTGRWNFYANGTAPNHFTGATTFGDYIGGTEITAPAAPAANGFRIYAEDNGAGKTRLMVKFATGAAVQIAIEP